MTKQIPSLIKYLILSLGVSLLAGCASDPCCEAKIALAQRGGPVTASATASASASAQAQQSDAAPTTPVKLLAVGHGSPGAYTQYTHAQQRLMAMRAAQVDAYRNLAEQVYGFRVWGGTSVSAFATQNDTVRSYVDAFIRGARVVNMTSIADGNFEATVELEVSPQFYHCITSQGACGTRPANFGSNPGMISPSSSYVSH